VLLKQVKVDLLVDVRSIPRSRMVPQFNFDTLPNSLAQEGIGYQHLRALGGRRHHPKGAPVSTNTFWHVLAFRNYADYAETDAFRAGFETSQIEFKGYKVHASNDEPQYEIKSDKTDHIAMHKGSALTKL
jgi:uncharacterized protein (DUF488 family)